MSARDKVSCLDCNAEIILENWVKYTTVWNWKTFSKRPSTNDDIEINTSKTVQRMFIS